MNEEHIVAAILAAGLLAQNKDDAIEPKGAVSLYGLCLSELIAANRAPKS